MHIVFPVLFLLDTYGRPVGGRPGSYDQQNKGKALTFKFKFCI